MAREDITLRSGEADSAGTAEVSRYGGGMRAVRAACFVTGGILGGAACIIVPVLHLITTWALPVLGIIAGWRAYGTRAVAREVGGPCPACGEPIGLNGGRIAGEPLLEPCPRCGASVEIVVAA